MEVEILGDKKKWSTKTISFTSPQEFLAILVTLLHVFGAEWGGAVLIVLMMFK